MPYWALADLQARLSPAVVLQLLDENNDGTADADALARLQEDADAYVDGFLRPVYSLDLIRADQPTEVKRLSLDVAVAYAALRHPEYVRRDGNELLAVARQQLKDLRNGATRLNVESTPEPIATSLAAAYSNDTDDGDCPPERVFDDLDIF